MAPVPTPHRPAGWRRGRALLAALVLVIGACAPAHRPIPDGVYYSDSGVDFIFVDAARFNYYGFTHPEHPDARICFPYTYEVLPDGQIFLGMADTDRFYRMGRYDLFWQDGQIVMIEREALREVMRDGERVTRLVEIEEASRPIRRFVRVR